jgi:hypothetical protein
MTPLSGVPQSHARSSSSNIQDLLSKLAFDMTSDQLHHLLGLVSCSFVAAMVSPKVWHIEVQ